MAKRVITDIMAAPKKEIVSELFREPKPSMKRARSSGKKSAGRFLGGALLLLFVLALWSFAFARMEVRISPKALSMDINKTILLNKNPGNHVLLFRTLTLADAREGRFSATENLSGATKAGGTVVIFNKSKDAQVLIASTRLEAPNGNIYKIPKTIVVPGAKQQNGESVPGSKETEAVADQPGENYNLGLSDFTLPGLRGSPRYELVFARSKTEIVGGGNANQIVVGRGDRDAALAELISRGRKEAENAILKKMPPGEFLLAPSVEYVVLSESSSPALGAAAESFSFKIEAEARAATINRDELEAALLQGVPEAASLGGSKMRIKNLEQLGFRMNGYKFDADKFNLEISGRAELEAELDEAAVKNTIAERDIRDATGVLSAFPDISRAEVRFKPFWIKLIYPQLARNPGRIDIILPGS